MLKHNLWNFQIEIDETAIAECYLTKECDCMKNLKFLFAALTVAFAVLGLTKALSTDITMPITFV